MELINMDALDKMRIKLVDAMRQEQSDNAKIPRVVEYKVKYIQNKKQPLFVIDIKYQNTILSIEL